MLSQQTAHAADRLDPPLDGATDDLILAVMPRPCEGLRPVLRFMIQTRGKRLRSRLLVLSAQTLAEDPEHLSEAAALVELLHNGTLLHDDVMDRATRRRDRPTVNRLWGDAVAILAGDFLLAAVMDLALRTGRQEVARLAVDTLMRLVSGQMQEIRNEGNLFLAEAEYMEILRGKTGALFSAACRLGGLIAGGQHERVHALETYGMEFGTAFQILDDLQDYLSTASCTGKEPGRDLAEGKVTLPLLFAFQKAPPETRQRLQRLFSERNPGPHLPEVRRLIRDLGGFSHARSRAVQCIQRAEGALAALPEGEPKRLLKRSAHHLIGKESA